LFCVLFQVAGNYQVESAGGLNPKGKDVKGNFECDECGRTFARCEHFKRHVRGHSGDKPYQCMICDRTFKRTDALRSHLRIHNVGVVPYKKQPVDEAAEDKSSDALLRHDPDRVGDNDLANANADSMQHQEMAMTSSGGKQFSCTFCQKVFHYSSHLTRHMTTHTDQKPFKCMLCDKLFARAERLMIHINTHFAGSSTNATLDEKSDNEEKSLMS